MIRIGSGYSGRLPRLTTLAWYWGGLIWGDSTGRLFIGGTWSCKQASGLSKQRTRLSNIPEHIRPDMRRREHFRDRVIQEIRHKSRDLKA